MRGANERGYQKRKMGNDGAATFVVSCPNDYDCDSTKASSVTMTTDIQTHEQDTDRKILSVNGTIAPTEEEGASSTDSNTAATCADMTFFKRSHKAKPAMAPAISIKLALKKGGNAAGLSNVEAGIPVLKISDKGTMQPRVLTISNDMFCVFVTHDHIIRGGMGVASTDASKLPLPLFSRMGFRPFTNDTALRERFVRYIDVADIEAVDVGFVGTRKLENARESNRLKGMDSLVDRNAHQIVSITYRGTETLDVLVLNDSHRRELVLCLEKMCRTYQDAKRLVSNDALLMRYLWYEVHADKHDGHIGETQFVKLLSLINLHLSDPRKVYRDFRKDVLGRSSGALTYPEIMSLLHSLKDSGTRSMANQLWDQIFGADKETVGLTEFMIKFCHGAQQDVTTAEQDVKNVFWTLNDTELNHKDGEPHDINTGEISRARFEVYLLHEINSAYEPTAINNKNVLDEPISRYWINTSHNTYLTGDQLVSASSVEMYMRVLRRGCKCVELDVWDGEKTDQTGPIPVVYHGHTVTSKILFADIVSVVKAYLEQNPLSYPIILSLENHCSPPYQRTLAFLLDEILGDRLYVPTDQDTKGELPSPESLRGKVIIKGKRPPEDDEEDEKLEEEEAKKDGESKGGDDLSNQTNISEKASTVPELAKLTLFHGTKYKAFETSITEPVSHMHSVSETKIPKILKLGPSVVPMWKLYNLHHMTRTYPAGTRVDSSNYNPLLAWSLGCQLVALNFQATDSPMVLNDGKFRQHSRSGYLRRPDGRMNTASEEKESQDNKTTVQEEQNAEVKDMLDDVMDSFEDIACGDEATQMLLLKQAEPLKMKNPETKKKSGDDGDPVTRLRIRVLSGSCLPKPKARKTGEQIDPYVTVTLHDVMVGATDGVLKYASKSQSTETVRDNGFCPVWNQPDDYQYLVHTPELAMVEFQVHDQDLGFDDFVAAAAIPFNCLRTGYRSVQLYGPNNTRAGTFGFATILVEVKIFTGATE